MVYCCFQFALRYSFFCAAKTMEFLSDNIRIELFRHSSILEFVRLERVSCEWRNLLPYFIKLESVGKCLDSDFRIFEDCNCLAVFRCIMQRLSGRVMNEL